MSPVKIWSFPILLEERPKHASYSWIPPGSLGRSIPGRGNPRNIAFWGNFPDHSHIFHICNTFLWMHIRIALNFFLFETHPKRYVETWIPTKLNFLELPLPGLLLSGDPGRGKSYEWFFGLPRAFVTWASNLTSTQKPFCSHGGAKD